jgi:hypothetical protein
MTATVPPGVDPDLYAQALAEIRAIPGARAVPGVQPTAPSSVSCCAGNRNGYQQHLRRGEEACEASTRAAAAYRREWRSRRNLAIPAVDAGYVQPADRAAEWARMAEALALQGRGPAAIADALCIPEDAVRALLGIPLLELVA